MKDTTGVGHVISLNLQTNDSSKVVGQTQKYILEFNVMFVESGIKQVIDKSYFSRSLHGHQHQNLALILQADMTWT